MSRLGARSSCETVRHPLPCKQLVHGCEQTPGADFATRRVRAGASLRLPRQQQSPVPARCSPGKSHNVHDPHSPDLLELSGLAVNSRQQEPGRLPHVIAVHRETAAVPGVSHRHPDPLHQRRQHDERPAGTHTSGQAAGPGTHQQGRAAGAPTRVTVAACTQRREQGEPKSGREKKTSSAIFK